MPENSGTMDMVPLIVTLAIAGVTMMVGLVVVSNIEASLQSATSQSLDTTSPTGSIFNMFSIGVLVVISAVILSVIVGLFRGPLRGESRNREVESSTTNDISQRTSSAENINLRWIPTHGPVHIPATSNTLPESSTASNDIIQEDITHKVRKYDMDE